MLMTTATQGSLHQRRETLRKEPNCRFIDPDEYRRLAVSREPLVRADDAASATLGLFDGATGTTYVVEAERVYS